MPGNKNSKLCGHCKEELPLDGDHCMCSMCSMGFHFNACSMKKSSWKGLGQERQNAWACTSCKARPKSDNGAKPSVDLTSQETAIKLDLILKKMETVEEIKNAIQFLSSQYDDLMKEVKEMREENKMLKEENKDIKKKLLKSEEAVTDLTQRVEEMEMYGRRVNLEIFGVPVRGRLQDENTTAVVEKIAEEIGVTYDPRDIHKLHRLQQRKDGKPPIILVQFMSTMTRDSWLRAGKRARLVDEETNGQIYFSENLTPYFKGLLREAKLRARMHSYKYTWVKGGKIMVRKNDNSPNAIIVKTSRDLDKIV